jgi:hypothetical protein
VAQDNNFTGNVDLLSANPRVGRGRDPVTGLPANEAILYGYSAATIVTVDAPIGSIALLTTGAPVYKAFAGITGWRPFGSSGWTLFVDRPLGPALTAVAPNNVFPLDALSDATPTFLTCPFAGQWLARFVCNFSHSGVDGGGGVNVGQFCQFFVNGVGAGDIALWGNPFTDAETWNQGGVLEDILTLAQGDQVGVRIGYPAATGWSAVYNRRSLVLTPA